MSLPSAVTVCIELTLPSLLALHERIALAAQTQVKEAGLLVAVKGTLGALPRKYSSMYYDVPLHDDGQIVYLNLTESMLAKYELQEGDEIKASGLIVPNLYRNKLEFQLRVTDVELLQSTEVLLRERDERASIERIKKSRRLTQPFPQKEDVLVSIICSKGSLVYDDFIGQLNGSDFDEVRFERIDASMTDSAAIVGAIEKATGDVIALIRGGGAQEEFGAFDHPKVADALAAKLAYRVVGLGHTEHTAVVCLVADAVFSTPTAAGAHVAAQHRAQMAGGRIQQLTWDNKRLREQVKEAGKGLGASGPQANNPPEATPSRAVWPYLLLGTVLGLLLFWLASSWM